MRSPLLELTLDSSCVYAIESANEIGLDDVELDIEADDASLMIVAEGEEETGRRSSLDDRDGGGAGTMILDGVKRSSSFSRTLALEDSTVAGVVGGEEAPEDEDEDENESETDEGCSPCPKLSVEDPDALDSTCRRSMMSLPRCKGAKGVGGRRVFE